jgi:uncharacterized protein (TIGR03067 family)
MRVRWTVLAVLAVAVFPGWAPADDAPKEMKYKFVSITVDGKKTPRKDLEDMVLIVKGNKGILKKGDKVISEATAKMDQSQDPWTIDIKITKGKEKGKTFKGIMKEKDGKMTVCWGAPGKDRPTKFSSKKGSGNILEVYELVKE